MDIDAYLGVKWKYYWIFIVPHPANGCSDAYLRPPLHLVDGPVGTHKCVRAHKPRMPPVHKCVRARKPPMTLFFARVYTYPGMVLMYGGTDTYPRMVLMYGGADANRRPYGLRTGLVGMDAIMRQQFCIFTNQSINYMIQHGKVLLLLTFLSISTLAFSQKYLIEGTIRDSDTREPVSSASIIQKNSGRGTTSGDQGYFKFEVISFPAALFIQCMGYVRDTVAIESVSQYISEFKNQNKTFLLKKSTE
ncbi:MAG: carboxypeptidase-like regulatory domain-containing protein [Bacteroidia bacterium]|nr:carboxypeptidase-like regulatory domain-containing protein [Bacteroidia bacterium]